TSFSSVFTMRPFLRVPEEAPHGNTLPHPLCTHRRAACVGYPRSDRDGADLLPELPHPEHLHLPEQLSHPGRHCRESERSGRNIRGRTPHRDRLPPPHPKRHAEQFPAPDLACHRWSLL